MSDVGSRGRLGRLLIDPAEHFGQPGDPFARFGNQASELLVVDDQGRAFAFQHVGQLRSGESGVQEQAGCAEPARRKQRVDEPAMVAAQDRDGSRWLIPESSEADGERVGALLDLPPRQGPAFVDEADAVRVAVGRQRETSRRMRAVVVQDARHAHVAAGPHGRDHPAAHQMAGRPDLAGQSHGDCLIRAPGTCARGPAGRARLASGHGRLRRPWRRPDPPRTRPRCRWVRGPG